LKQIVRDITLVSGWDEEEDRAALVMLAPLSNGTLDAESVSRFTGAPPPEVRGVHDRLAENGDLGPGATSTWSETIRNTRNRRSC